MYTNFKNKNFCDSGENVGLQMVNPIQKTTMVTITYLDLDMF